MVVTRGVKISIGIACFGLVVAIATGVILSQFPALVKMMIDKNLVLNNQSEVFEKWHITPVPIYMRVYLFNVTNPVDITYYGDKPKLQEVGPFTFKQSRVKEVLKWDNDQHTIKYYDVKTYHFLREESVMDQSAVINVLNVPLVGILGLARKISRRLPSIMGALIQPGINLLVGMTREQLFIPKTVEEMLFKGYQVHLMKYFGVARIFSSAPDPLPNNTFGLFYNRNGTNFGPLTVNTGEDDPAKFGTINSWKSMRTLPYWGSHYCNMINGSDGSQFKPFIKRDDTLYVFAGEICRSLYLQYETDSEVKGIPTYRFTAPKALFDSGYDNGDNLCYCPSRNRCLKPGVLSVAPCYNDSPIVASPPHFYQGSESYINSMEGLDPEKDKHYSYVDIEPTTGIVMNASRKLQLNILIEKTSGIYPFDREDAIFPLAWLSETATISDELLEEFKSKVIRPLTLAPIVLMAALIVGVIITVICLMVIMFLICTAKRSPKPWPKVKSKEGSISSSASVVYAAQDKKVVPVYI